MSHAGVTIGFVPAIYSILEREPQVTVFVVLIDGILETSVTVNVHTTGATATGKSKIMGGNTQL